MSEEVSDLKEPKPLTAEQIFKDLQESRDDDPLASGITKNWRYIFVLSPNSEYVINFVWFLFTEDVKTILAELKPLYSGGKWEIMKSEAFDTSEKIVQLKEDLLSKKAVLLNNYENLSRHLKELEEIGKSVQNEGSLWR